MPKSDIGKVHYADIVESFLLPIYCTINIFDVV